MLLLQILARELLYRSMSKKQNGCLSIQVVDFLTSRHVKKVFLQQQSLHIDENGVFHLVSTLHRSLTANRVEIMRKLQKKVNQACISTLDQHKIGCKERVYLVIGLICSC